MRRGTFIVITVLITLVVLPMAREKSAGAVTIVFSPGQTTGNVIREVELGYAATAPSPERETKVVTTGIEYKKIRRRYRFLEFFSLGFLLVLAFIVLFYLLRLKKKSEEARGLRSETYSVEELDSQSSIANHFGMLIEQKTELTARFEGISRQFTTTPRGFRDEDKIFFSDALIPSPGKGLPLEGANVKIEYLYREIPYSFLTQLLSEPGNGDDEVAFRIPELIKYTQRRHTYRVKLPVLEQVTATFTLSGRILKETVLDISTGGFSLKSANRYLPGTTYRDVKLNLPGKKPLKMDAKCVYRFPSPPGGEEKIVRFGFAFVGPGITQEKTLMGFVSDLKGRIEEG